MTSRNPAFLPFVRKPVVDPNPSVLTDGERADMEAQMQAGTTPRYSLVRKAVRLSDERKLVLDRVQRVVEQARAMPFMYPGNTAVDFIHNILRGDDDLA